MKRIFVCTFITYSMLILSGCSLTAWGKSPSQQNIGMTPATTETSRTIENLSTTPVPTTTWTTTPTTGSAMTWSVKPAIARHYSTGKASVQYQKKEHEDEDKNEDENESDENEHHGWNDKRSAKTQTKPATAVKPATKPSKPAAKPVTSVKSTIKPSKPVTTPAKPVSWPKIYTLTDVQSHATATNCRTIVNSSVYDVTSRINQHPGWAWAIKSMCGKDASAAFNGQHGWQARPESELAGFKIGIVK